MSDWYYSDASGAQMGPVSFEDLSAKVRSGEVSAQAKAWTEGMADWQSVGEISQLASLVPAGSAPAANPYQASPAAGNSSPDASSFGAPPANWLWQSIVALCLSVLLFCFCFPLLGIPTSIVALVFASGVNSKWAMGQFESATDAAKKAKLWSLISLGIVVGGVALYFLLNVLLGGLSFMMDPEEFQNFLDEYETENSPQPGG